MSDHTDTDTVADEDADYAAAMADDSDSAESSPEPTQDDEQTQEGPPHRVGYRQRLKDAEAERDRLTDVLTRTRNKILDDMVGHANLTREHVPGLNVEDYLDETGLPDVARIAQHIEAARLKLGVPSRPKPNPLVGGGNEAPTARGLADVLRDYVRGAT